MSAVDLSASEVRTLREKTGAGMMDCKRALQEVGGDMEKAVEFLRKRGVAAAEKKLGRETKQGSVVSYIHAGGKIGVLVEINCETDFVARNENFQAFSRDVAMHVAAANPRFLNRAAVPETVLEKEKEIFMEQAKQSGKPAQVLPKIVEGKVEKFYAEVCLLEQPYIKNPDITVEGYLKDIISKLGENIVISRFVRFELGRTS